MPMYQNRIDVVMYVETANTSHMSGLRNCGHIEPMSFGMRDHPPREPGAAGVEQREQAGAHDGEDRHRLGGRG